MHFFLGENLIFLACVLQSVGSQRVGYDLATEQQQKNQNSLNSIFACCS